MSTTMPDRYRPDTAGHSRVNGSSPRSLSAKITQGALAQLGVGEGEYVFCLPRSDDSLTLVPHKRTGIIAQYRVYQPESNPCKSVECSVSGALIDYLGLDVGDRIVYRYPEDRTERRMIAEGVRADE